jgi:hypothetical protein
MTPYPAAGPPPSAGFTAAFAHAAPFVVAGFAVCGVLALALPRTAVSEVPE